MFEKLLGKVKKYRKDSRYYFSEQNDQILKLNLQVYEILSYLGIIGNIILIIITKTMYTDKVTFYYIMFALIVFFAIMAFYINRHGLKSANLERVLCVLFSICIFIMLIYTDTVISPEKSQVFSAAFLVIAPAIYIMTFSRMIIDQVFFSVVYSIFAFRFKENIYALHDMFAIAAGFVFGCVLYMIIMNLRIKAYEEMVNFRNSSHIDELTGIYNRRAANENISYMLKNRTQDKLCALMMMDVDSFKNINDTYGHKKGDTVLINVAKILSDAFGKKDIVSRYGGDEFLVFIPEFGDEKYLVNKCEEVQHNMKAILKGEFIVTCSIGIITTDDGELSLDELVGYADKALYETKVNNKGQYTFFRVNKKENGKKHINK